MNAFSKFKKNLLRFGLEYFSLYYGTYRGVVISNDDPDKRGRIKATCPSVWGKAELDVWILPRGIYAGNKTGFHFMPQKGDPVHLTFENGDPDYPMWEYGWWLKDGAIETAAKDVFVLATPMGHTITIDEAEETIHVSYKKGKAIEITEKVINLGTVGGAKEWAVLGETLNELLKEFKDDVGNISAIPCTVGVTGTINSSPLWTALNTKWNTKFEEFLSEVVKLD